MAEIKFLVAHKFPGQSGKHNSSHMNALLVSFQGSSVRHIFIKCHVHNYYRKNILVHWSNFIDFLFKFVVSISLLLCS